MDLQKQFKEETKQDAYYLDQTTWNDYYIEWLESKIEKLLIEIVVWRSEPLKLNPQICYKSNEPCKYDCHGLCKESC